ncbi:MAG: 4-vinyl reductase [Thermoplasmata archaeon]|nr:4-vinyl reductase [Thermoplasmata archaeon]
MMTEGTCRASIFQTNISYLRKKKGSAGLAYLDNYLKARGLKLTIAKIEEMKPSEHIPLSTRIVFLEGCLALFENDIEKLKAMGREAPTASLILKLFIKYFVGPNSAINQGPPLWREHYSIGTLEVIKNEKGIGVIGLKDFKVSKIMCHYLCGYFEGVGVLCRAKNTVCKETKCVHDGADHCEFVITWEA